MVDRALDAARRREWRVAHLAALALDRVEAVGSRGDPLAWPGVEPAHAALLDLVVSNHDTVCEPWVRECLSRLGHDYDQWRAEAFRRVGSHRMVSFVDDRSRYKWVDVALLPHAHSPKRRRDPFDEALATLCARNRWRSAVGAGRDDDALLAAAGERWLRQFTVADCGPPPRPLPDVASAVGTVNEVHRAVPADGWGRGALRRAAATAAGRDGVDEGVVLSFFFDPVWWVPGWPQLVNGQHRVAAARVQGVGRLLVVVERQ